MSGVVIIPMGDSVRGGHVRVITSANEEVFLAGVRRVSTSYDAHGQREEVTISLDPSVVSTGHGEDFLVVFTIETAEV